MSLFRSSLRRPPITSDEAVRRYVEAIRPRLEPDPGFQRRLRGEMLNRYVLSREEARSSTLPAAARSVARAALLASLALAITVGGTMAASQSAIPGDLLYPVKLEIEELRVTLLPESFRGELATHSLAERINELGRLVEAGEWELAAGLAGSIEDEVATLTGLGMTPSADGALAGPLATLSLLLQSLPLEAQTAVEEALGAAPGLLDAGPGTGSGAGDDDDGEENGNGNGGGNGNNGNGNNGNGSSGNGNDPNGSGNGSGNGNNGGGNDDPQDEPAGNGNGTDNGGGNGNNGGGNDNGNNGGGNDNGNKSGGNGNGPKASAAP
jgi:hypothetical protein